MKKIGIIGAMEVEIRTLTEKIENLAKTELGSLSFFEGLLNGVSVVVVRSGVGKVNAALCAQQLILRFGATHVINTGVAGATAAGAGILDIVVSTDAVYHDVDATGFGYAPMEIPQLGTVSFPADESMIRAAQRAFAETLQGQHKLFTGRVATGDQFVSSKAVKAAIIAKAAPACVEMEGAAIAHACWLNKIPFVIIRSLSDTADESAESLNSSWTEKASAEECAALTLKALEYI